MKNLFKKLGFESWGKLTLKQLVMEKWEITINLKTGELGLEKLKTREFIEL